MRPAGILCLFVLMLVAAPARAQQDSPTASAPTLPQINIPEVVPDDTAQRAQTQAAATLALLAKMPQPVQEDLLKEADLNKDYCQHNELLRHFYDCDCFSLRMMDERIKIGPGTPSVNMIAKTDLSACVSPGDIAGYGLHECNSALEMSSLPTDKLKAICDCAARSLAINFQRHPVADIRNVDALFADARASCHQQIGF